VLKPFLKNHTTTNTSVVKILAKFKKTKIKALIDKAVDKKLISNNTENNIIIHKESNITINIMLKAELLLQKN